MKEGRAVPEAVRAAVAAALGEDRADEDATALAVVPAAALAQARIVARAPGVLAGTDYACEAFRSCDAHARVDLLRGDGARVEPGEVVLEVEGRAAALLAAERTALNFLQQLSGTATATAALVSAAGPALAVLDTRKTVPGLRDAQKAAVRAGGGANQRRDLADELLLKENHFALSGRGYADTVRRALEGAGGRTVGVEAETLEEARAALAAGAHYVLLDDFPPAALADAVATLRGEFPGAVLEASGGVTLERLPAIAATGVDRVSVGALTHSAPALDLSLQMRPAQEAGRPW